MTFEMSGTVVRWPDGSEGTVHQEAFDWSTDRRQAYLVRLKVVRQGQPDITGALRFTLEAHERMPGRDDAEKANAVARKLVSRVAEKGLTDGFFFRVDADDFGVEVFEASD